MHRSDWAAVRRAINLSSTPRQLVSLLPGPVWFQRPKTLAAVAFHKPGGSESASAFLVRTAVIALACLCPLAALLSLLFLYVLCPAPSPKI